MNSSVYDKGAPKRAVNVSVNADLATKAKALGVNLSEALETRLAELVATAERQKWLTEMPPLSTPTMSASRRGHLSDWNGRFDGSVRRLPLAARGPFYPRCGCTEQAVRWTGNAGGTPLYPLNAKDKPILRLNPVVEIEGQLYLLAI